MSFTDIYETTRIHREKQCAQRDAQKKYYDGLSPDQLAAQLRDKCNLTGIDSLADLEKRLLQQALTLDSSFFVSMHSAGLGQKSSLDLDPMKIALFSQKLCRQTYDTLKSSEKEKLGKQTKEPKK